MNGQIKCTVEGRIASDPVVRTSAAGKDWVALNISVGEGSERQWLSVSAFNENVAVCAGLPKGVLVRVEGRLKLNSWIGKDGTQRSGLQVSASSVELITGGRSSGAQRKASGSQARADYARPSETDPRPASRDQSAASERDPVRQDAIPF